MDFIIKRLNSYINVAETNSIDRQTLLRERLEYMLFEALGVLWNQNLNEIDVEKRKEIVKNLYRMSIGQVVSAIRQLDIHNSIISKKQLKVLDGYPELRNQTLGHGYTHEDKEKDIEQKMEDLYNELKLFEFFLKSFDIVQVTKINNDICEGVRYSEVDNGIPKKWTCPMSIISSKVNVEDVFLQDLGLKYYKISPFVCVADRGDSIYVFQSLEDKLSGSIRLNRLFKSGMINMKAKELICVSTNSEKRRISSNGSIMNYFDINYNTYIKMPIEQSIKEFLKENRSNVQATVWGHGGVGKTSCVQNICMELFNSMDNLFSYIIFVSAKDRKYDVQKGEILGIKGIRTYEEIIDNLISVIFDNDDESFTIDQNEERIRNEHGNTLLVIDDYETFDDDEKVKIQKFINTLNIDNFKVIITTRNKRFSSGIEFKVDELSEKETKNFLLQIFKNDYLSYYNDIYEELSSELLVSQIYQATSGRALLLYQFVNLFIQKGLNDKLIEDIKVSEDAKEFLYGRIFEYLGDEAKKIYMLISQIIDENDMIFNEEIVSFIFNSMEADVVEEGIQELVEQKVIEKYDENFYRVYSKDMVERMGTLFNNADEKFRNHVADRLRMIGGKNIKGSVYEAMLIEANSSRNIGNVKDTLQKYKQILNDSKCNKDIKKKALLNLTSYISINLADNEQTVGIFDRYVKKLGFDNDVDIIKMYVQYLWRMDIATKEKACDILDRFFKNKSHKKTQNEYIELFAIATNYLCHNVLENVPEQVICSAENRIINEYSMPLYEFVEQSKFNDFKPAIRHNVSIALIASLKVLLDLSKHGYDKKNLENGIKNFGFTYFNQLFKRQLEGIVGKRQDVKEGDIIEAVVTYIARYGILVEIEGIGKAIIHNTEMDFGLRNQIKKGSRVKAIIIGQNEKGVILSTKKMENGLKDKGY